MFDITTIIFSFLALLCGSIASFWILKLKEELVQERHALYELSALVAISFLISFPLWIMFSEFFPYSLAIKRISYLIFSLGYFGVLLVAYFAVTEVKSMKGYISEIKGKHYQNKRLLHKLKRLESENKELEKFRKISVGRELKMVELKKQIEKLKTP